MPSWTMKKCNFSLNIKIAPHILICMCGSFRPKALFWSMLIHSQVEHIRIACNPHTHELYLYPNYKNFCQPVGHAFFVKEVLFMYRANWTWYEVSDPQQKYSIYAYHPKFQVKIITNTIFLKHNFFRLGQSLTYFQKQYFRINLSSNHRKNPTKFEVNQHYASLIEITVFIRKKNVSIITCRAWGQFSTNQIIRHILEQLVVPWCEVRTMNA